MRALPGVQAAGAIDDLPSQGGSVQPIVLEGHAELLPRDQPTVAVRKITPGYLRAMQHPAPARARRRRQRRRGDAGQPRRPRSCCGATPIRSAAASRCRSSRRPSSRQVIGIVGDVKQGELSEAAAPTVYEYTRERAWTGSRDRDADVGAAGVARAGRPRASSARSIRSSRSRTSGRWTTCSTRR